MLILFFLILLIAAFFVFRLKDLLEFKYREEGEFWGELIFVTHSLILLSLVKSIFFSNIASRLIRTISGFLVTALILIALIYIYMFVSKYLASKRENPWKRDYPENCHPIFSKQFCQYLHEFVFVANSYSYITDSAGF